MLPGNWVLGGGPQHWGCESGTASQRDPALPAVNRVLSSPHGQVPMRLRSCRTAPALPSPSGGWDLGQGLEGGAWLHVCGEWTVSQSHVCGEQVFRLCVVSMFPRGPASVLAAALSPRRPPCPGLVTSQKGASVSSGNSESPGLPQGSGHTCTPVPTAHQSLVQSEQTQAPSPSNTPRARRYVAWPVLGSSGTGK